MVLYVHVCVTSLEIKISLCGRNNLSSIFQKRQVFDTHRNANYIILIDNIQRREFSVWKFSYPLAKNVVKFSRTPPSDKSLLIKLSLWNSFFAISNMYRINHELLINIQRPISYRGKNFICSANASALSKLFSLEVLRCSLSRVSTGLPVKQRK